MLIGLLADKTQYLNCDSIPQQREPRSLQFFINNFGLYPTPSVRLQIVNVSLPAPHTK